MPLELLRGQKDDFTFACTYCGSLFPARLDLELHWQIDARCRTNRFVNNPLQTKYMDADVVSAVPGEHNLYLIRSKTCQHEADNWRMKDLKDDTGHVFAQQCMNCYTTLPLNDA